MTAEEAKQVPQFVRIDRLRASNWHATYPSALAGLTIASSPLRPQHRPRRIPGGRPSTTGQSRRVGVELSRTAAISPTSPMAEL